MMDASGSMQGAAFPDIPTIEEVAGIELPLGAWRGLVGPAGLSDDISAKLVGAMHEIVSSDSWRLEMAQRGFGVEWRSAAEFEDFMLQQQREVRAILETLSL